MVTIALGKSPQNGKNASKPGAYTLVVESNSPLAYPGQTVTLRLFISGYGTISNPKLFVLMPPGLHDEERSYIYYNLSKKQPHTFGARKDKLLQSTTIGFGGMKAQGWDESTFMFDMHSEHPTPAIASETSQIRAPFELEIKIKKISIREFLQVDKYKNRPKSGRHPVQFVLTYFNGQEWVSMLVAHDLTLPSWYQRHTLLTWGIGIGVALIGIVIAILQLAAAIITIRNGC